MTIDFSLAAISNLWILEMHMDLTMPDSVSSDTVAIVSISHIFRDLDADEYKLWS